MNIDINLNESKIMLELLEQKVDMPQYADVANDIDNLIVKIRFPGVNFDFLYGGAE